MKHILLFIVSFIIGFLILFGVAKQFPRSPFVSYPTPSQIPSFSLATPPNDSLRATITSMSGDIYWQSRTATQPALMREKRALLQGENIVTKEQSNLMFTYPHQATISLEQNSELAIIQTIPKNLIFNQIAGTITYRKTGTLPLSVVFKNLVIDQKSGEMRVISETETQIITLQMVDGEATCGYTNDQSIVTHISKGQTYVFDIAANEGTVQEN